MPPRYEVVVLPAASLDIENAFEYIYNSLENPQAAWSFLDGIHKKIESLRIFPDGNQIFEIEPWASAGFRRARYKHYTILYKVLPAEKTVAIARVSYARRDFTRLEIPD